MSSINFEKKVIFYAELLAKVKERATAAGRFMTDDEFRRLVLASCSA